MYPVSIPPSSKLQHLHLPFIRRTIHLTWFPTYRAGIRRCVMFSPSITSCATQQTAMSDDYDDFGVYHWFHSSYPCHIPPTPFLLRSTHRHTDPTTCAFIGHFIECIVQYSHFPSSCSLSQFPIFSKQHILPFSPVHSFIARYTNVY
jgi:hypothetical protein